MFRYLFIRPTNNAQETNIYNQNEELIKKPVKLRVFLKKLLHYVQYLKRKIFVYSRQFIYCQGF